MSREPVDIIILAYNRLSHLQRMVDAIAERTQYPHRITIVDNASQADVRAWLYEQRARFHQVIFNPKNQHLGGLQRGIEATSGERFIVSDADLIPPPTIAGRCWLTRQSDLMDRHPDFGMIGCRIVGGPMPPWHIPGGAETKLVDGEIMEGSTGVWLNLIRRPALQVPFESDGMTCHAIRRAGFRVGVGADLQCDHLGDEDVWRFPDYLARKNAQNGLGVVYAPYAHVADVPRPPSLLECALAAAHLDELESRGIALTETVELGAGTSEPVISAVEAVLGAGLGVREPRDWELAVEGRRAPWSDASVGAVSVHMGAGHDEGVLAEALRIAARAVVVTTPAQSLTVPAGFELREVRPPNDTVLSLAKVADRSRRLRAMVGYTSLEQRTEWLGLFRHARFGARHLRMYVLTRAIGASHPAPAPRCQRCNGELRGDRCECGALRRRTGPRAYKPPFGRTWLGAIGAKLTQLSRAASMFVRVRPEKR